MADAVNDRFHYFGGPVQDVTLGIEKNAQAKQVHDKLPPVQLAVRYCFRSRVDDRDQERIGNTRRYNEGRHRIGGLGHIVYFPFEEFEKFQCKWRFFS